MTNIDPDAPIFEEDWNTDQSVTRKKRSPLERTIVWGFIFIALIVVLIEGNARFGYSQTLAQMQNQMDMSEKDQDDVFFLSEADELVKGFPIREERVTKSSRKLQYRWFSLFKSYVIQISLDSDNGILMVKTEVDPFPDLETLVKSSEISLKQLGLPPAGLGNEFAKVAVLGTDSLDSRRPDLEGLLTREIVRQALLIGGRDGLGLQTRDASLRGEVILTENPERFPLQLITQISWKREVNIELIQPLKTEFPLHWNAETFTLPEQNCFEALVHKLEALSRNEFVDALKTVGYSGTAPLQVKESTIPRKVLQQLHEWNIVSQYNVIREMHSAIENKGESPQRLAVLVLAYSNLGNLTDFLWSPAHKVFKARALLYAERLVVRTENSPWALAHRAYARAFAGIHQSALADIASIRATGSDHSAKAPATPAWIDLIEAYCTYQPAVLEKAVNQQDTKHLAIYLRCLLTDPTGNKKQTQSVTEELLKLAPACCQAMDRLCEVNSLGDLRRTTQVRQDKIWPEIYQKLLESNLPEAIKSPIQSRLTSLFNFTGEQKFRIRVTDSLKNSTAVEYQPSLNALGQLLQEISFIHTYRKLNYLSSNLSVSADRELASCRSLVEGHPYELFIESYASDPRTSQAAFEKLLQVYDPLELELTSFPMILSSNYKLNQDAYSKLYMAALANIDIVYEDQLQHVRCIQQLLTENREDLNNQSAEKLLKVSPHMPQTIALDIKTDQEYTDPRHAELMKQYGDNVIVLTAMAHRYQADHQDDKAEKVLLHQIDIAPDYRSYTALANLYYAQVEKEKWKATLEKTLDFPTAGLENANVHSKLAYYHMGRQEWDLAEPHALEAASTYSGWGLQCAARCYEGLGDLQQAEKYWKACAERYHTSSAEWFFWCIRTNHGDRESARQLAEQNLLANPEVNNLNLRMQLGVYHLIQGQEARAYETFQSAFKQYQDTFCGMHAALLADKLNLPDQRDQLLTQISEQWVRYFGLAELSNMFQRMLQNPDTVEWNPKSFESLVAQLPDGSPTNFYYFAAIFLEQRGQQKHAHQLLQQAASSPSVQKYNCMLAAHYLRKLNQKIDPRRSVEQISDYGKTRPLLEKSFYLRRVEKFDEAIQVYDELLKSNPKLVTMLINRAKVKEKRKQYAAAINDYQKAIEIDPEFWLPYNNLAFLLAGCEDEEIRDGDLAVQNAQQAFDLLPTKFWINYAAMAVAYAESGQFEKAVEMQKQAVIKAPEKEKYDASKRVSLFKEGKPYRRNTDKLK